MERSKFKSLVFLLILSCASLQAGNIYADWFIHQSHYPGLIVGYTYGSMTPQEDAENMYAAYQDCIVWGTLEIFNTDESNDLLKNSDYYYYFSPDSLARIKGRLKEVDRFQVNIFFNDYIAAFYLDDSVRISEKRLQTTEIPRPSWLERTFWQDGANYYGVGAYTTLGRENDGWKTAEEQGIFTILNALAVEIHNLNLLAKNGGEDYQQESTEQIKFINLKYHLKHISIVERFPDLDNKLYYVLVRIPKKDVWSPMFR